IDRSRCSGGTCDRPSATTREPIDSEPLSIRSIPARQRSSVVLPEPDGPSSTRNVPGATSSDTDFKAGTAAPGYVLVSERTEIGSATNGPSYAPPPGRREQTIGPKHDADNGEGDGRCEHGLGHADAVVIVRQVVLDGDRGRRGTGRVQQLRQGQFKEDPAERV